MLEDGLYEQLVNQLLKEKINDGSKIVDTRELSEEDASRTLSRYVAEVVELGMNSCNNVSSKIQMANNLIENLQLQTNENSLSSFAIPLEKINDKGTVGALELLSVSGRENNVRTVNDNVKPVRPQTSLVESSLFTGSEKEPSMFAELQKEILTADRIDMLVSFIRCAGIRLIYDQLKLFTGRGGKLRIITTSYMGVTEAAAVEKLAELPNTEIKICYETKHVGLHAKAYVFCRNTGFSTAYIGSSNLSQKAISYGLEWNLKITRKELPETFDKVEETFDIYWNSSDFEIFSLDGKSRLIQALKQEKQRGSSISKGGCYLFEVRPYNYQQEILDKLQAEREVRNNYHNLVVAATGTGKTVISAFDYRNFWKNNHNGRVDDYPKLLFVAHRKEILVQSLETFRAVLRDANFGELMVDSFIPEKFEHLFVSIQSLNSKSLTEKLTPDYYDFIIVDEFHHAAAPSYQKLLSYFTPKILLGLTATPERMDGEDILRYFNYRVAADIRLPEAIEKGLLCPFQYFGVSDTVDLSEIRWTAGGYDKKELSNVYSLNTAVAERRADSVIMNLNKYAMDLSTVRGLGFCVSVEHARFMSDFFNRNGIASEYLTGNSDDELRNGVKSRLVKGELSFIFVVDIYNEGVDIPEVNTILFLRPTESLTVFLQQLGRGLRLADGKDCLTVLDFIGQANKKYNFEDKFRALLSRTRKGVADEVKNRFPSVPKGCYISLEKKASEYVLSNISGSYSSRKGILSRMATFAEDSGEELTLSAFLRYYKLSPKIFYKYKASFSSMMCACGFIDECEEVFDGRAWYGLAVIDSRRWIGFLLDFLPKAETADFNALSVIQKKMLRMFCFTLWDKVNVEDDVNAGSIKGNILRLVRNRIIMNEVMELLEYNLSRIDFVDRPVLDDKDLPLDLYCTYSRNQILVAFDYYNVGNMREGVKYFDDCKTDIFLVTLNKSDRDYSPTTMYKDYSINENLFHWQSQSTTGDTSATGMRYINHAATGNTILLFVRERKNTAVSGFTESYTFLGKANYVSHTGNKPMSIIWRLEDPIPSKFLKKTSKLLVG
ncbi:Helicase conserved C-terminal domain-containing protein [Ruminobacter amylophilus]|uniref:Helicase conserved C-terminal domain-containing protein n=1 Tax=Ruminobacter amylophilus TaxID=867 RepID=A0A662ZGB7_9GAMM|nr:DEAD/DEAH box helicase [Ruminobacter amylophilus]SFP26511.1 Helicase conserved C-terminal domain-containing protein [Ruminobacter amylophilus]